MRASSLQLHHPAVRRPLYWQSPLFSSFLFISVSPYRRIFGGAEKLQPIVEYKPRRSYNRSAVGVTRRSLNTAEKWSQTNIFGVNDTNSNMFCLQLQTLGLVRSSKQSCRTLWSQGACSPSERSSEKVGARDLQHHWCSLTQKCCTKQHQITVDFNFERGIWLCGGGTFETSRGNVRKGCSEDDEMWDFWN